MMHLLEAAGALETTMLSKSGLHPYDEMLLYLLREFKTRGPKSRTAVVDGDITALSQRISVRMLAAGFNKSDRQVARDLINLERDLEYGRPT
jgi:hypothetical protein